MFFKSKLFMTVALLATGMGLASAAPAFTVESPLTVKAGETLDVLFSVESDVAWGEFNLDVQLPEGLTFVKIANADYKGSVDANNLGSVVKVGSFYMSLTGVEPGTTSAFTMTLQAAEDLAEVNEVKVSNIVISGIDATAYEQDEFTIVVQKAAKDPATFTLTTESESVEVRPTETIEIPVSLENNYVVSTIGGQITVPEGFTVELVASGRLQEDGLLYLATTGRFIYLSNDGSDIAGNEGVLFTIKLTAPETIEEGAVLTISGITVSDPEYVSYDVEPLTISVLDLQAIEEEAAQQEAEETLADLQERKDEALEGAFVTDAVTEAANKAQEAIDAAKQAVEDAETINGNEEVAEAIAAAQKAVEELESLIKDIVTSIASVKTAGNEVIYFTVNGVRIDKPAKGSVVIARMPDGTTRKVRM